MIKDNQYGLGDGLTFFMTPFEMEHPMNAYGRGLGLFNGSFYQMVAVEFDSYKNEWHPTRNHVGMGINDVFSKLSVSLRKSNPSSYPDLINEETWDAYLDYDG
ncbi:anti-H(O) lectin-like [Cryptomeria japonica]|uniref:anti-H(O) lectin-like n=1 Tax=Cryptomeria japonica TaxID=3369 RepID=UPI0027DA314B|nr:anti-H(O) lectin-like [Cryptomeria japonica]